MSRKRLAWISAVLVGVVGGAIAGTEVALPLGWSIGGVVVHAQQVLDSRDAGVTPPKLVTAVHAQYTAEAMKAKVEGDVMLSAVVRPDGTPGDVEITKSLDPKYGMDERAMAALSQWRFEPGLKDGEAVPVRITVQMWFSLKK